MASNDTLTLALALWGAATGTLATFAQVYSAWRDRPRLKMDGHLVTSMDHAPRIMLGVLNVGTRPTTVREIGFHAHESEVTFYEDIEATEPTHTTVGELGCTVARSIFLEAGEAKEFDATSAVLAMGLWADEPLRAYAKDINGRRVWGGAARVVRQLFGPDPPLDKLPDDLRKILSTPPPEKFRLPAKVEPRWKVWKKRELRNPKVWEEH